MSDPQATPAAPELVVAEPATPVVETAPVAAVATPEVHGVIAEIEAEVSKWTHAIGTDIHDLIAKLKALF